MVAVHNNDQQQWWDSGTVTEVVEGEGEASGVGVGVSTAAGVLVGTLSELDAASVDEATREEEALAAHRLEL